MIVDHRNVGAAFRRLSLPVAVQMVGDQLLGVVDTIVIGSLGAVALAGATAANVTFLVIAFSIFGLMTGTSIVAAQRIGAGDVDGFALTVRSGVLIPILCGIAYLLLALVGAAPVIYLLVGHLPSAGESATCLMLRCASLVPIAISGTSIVGISAAGNRILGIIVLLAINLVHIPLVLVLALGWLTHHPYGIVGAGESSLISEVVGSLCALAYVAAKPAYKIFASLRISITEALRCARIGLPESIFLVGVMLPDVVIVGMLSPLGPVIVSAFRALNIVSDLTMALPIPLQQAAQTVIGQRLGAGDPDGARWFFVRAQRVAIVVGFAGGAVAAAFAWPLAFAFTLNATVASIAAVPLALHMITMPLKGWAMVSIAPIRAAGDTQFSMLIGLACSALVIPFAWFCIERLHIGLYSIPVSWVAAWIVRAVWTQFKLRDDSWATRPRLAE
ncbi:MAG TPA: MATE family efflux transporter [Candidatus Tumulicola sp.]